MEKNAKLIAFIDRLKASRDMDDAWLIFDVEVKTYGIENALYGFIMGTPKQLPEEDIFFHSHREDFLDAYDQGGYMDCDWSLLHCQSSTETALWSTPEMFSKLNAKQMEGELLAQDFGLLEGIAIPLRGGTSLGWGGVGFSATGMRAQEWYRFVALHQLELEALVQAFHEFVLSRGYFNVFGLSPRERETLKWVVHGLDKHAIADKFNISYKTSEVHMYRIRQKLKCVNDAQVTAKALVYNLIE